VYGTYITGIKVPEPTDLDSETETEFTAEAEEEYWRFLTRPKAQTLGEESQANS
jgi:hypothetical protein